MSKYRTQIAGMTGTGEPIVPEGAVPAEGGNEPLNTGGGAFTGMQVTEHVKAQIEQGTAADFFYFEPSKDAQGTYEMHAKLPEYGCDGPGKPVFKLRENNNRLMKGFAKKMLKPDGTLDIDKGARFITEFNLRFGLDEGDAPYCPEMPLETDLEQLRESAINCLCGELEIPMEERADFKNFARAAIDFAPMMDDEHPVNGGFGKDGRILGTIRKNGMGKDGMSQLWIDFLSNCISAQKLLNDERAKLPVEEGKQENDFQRNVRQYNEALEELRSTAAMDPAAQMKIIVPTECSGSTVTNLRYAALANQANKELGRGEKEIKIQDFGINFENCINNINNKPMRVQAALQQLENDRNEGKFSPAQYEAEKARLNRELQEANALKDEFANKKNGHVDILRWIEHHAPVVGSFKDDNGKEYFLTIEAFAPESDSLSEHPGATTSVAIGVYSNHEDFVNYYLKDNPYPENKPESKDFVEFRINEQHNQSPRVNLLPETILDGRPLLEDTYHTIANLKREFKNDYQQTMRTLGNDKQSNYVGDVWSREYKNHIRDMERPYQPTAGKRHGELNSQYQEDFADVVRDGMMKRSGVPEEHLPVYDRIFTLAECLLTTNADYGKHDMAFKMLLPDQKYNEQQKAILEEIYDEDNQYSNREDRLIEQMRALEGPLKRMLSGNPHRPADLEKAGVVNFLQEHGIQKDEFAAFLDGVGQNLKPVTEAVMDVQVSLPQIAVSEHEVDRADHGGGTSEVPGEGELAVRGVFRLKIGVDVSAPESVDGLFGVADHVEEVVAALRKAFVEDAVLDLVGVLKFVHENRLIPFPDQFRQTVVLLKRFVQAADHVVERHHAVLVLFGLNPVPDIAVDVAVESLFRLSFPVRDHVARNDFVDLSRGESPRLSDL